jgi:carboxypeptidase family protein
MRHRIPRHGSVLLVSAVLAAGLTAKQVPQPPESPQRRPPVQRPARDANRPAAEPGSAILSGRVLAADTGRPMKRARVLVSGGGRPRAVTTDELGRYQVSGLPAGTYTISATKAGFVDATYGQRRWLRPGAPVQLADGQQATNIDLRLMRGGVITGHVIDEDGDPLARAMVNVLRYQYVRGQRQLTPVGTDQSDDRGQYRIFGLPPGDYFVSATAGGVERIVGRLIEAAGARGRGGAQAITADEQGSTGYAATYYPGTIALAEAGRLKLAAAQELGGVDFQLQIVALATVRGNLAEPRGIVVLVPDEGTGAQRGPGLRAAVKADGSFLIANVPPGKYTAIARGEQQPLGSDSSVAMQTLTVSGGDVTVTLVPVRAARASGMITFETAGTTTPASFNGFRITAVPLDTPAAPGRAQRPVEVNADGAFGLSGLMPGRYAIQGTGARGWTMKAATLDGRDVSDEPFEIKGGEDLKGLTVIFSDQTSGLVGNVRNGGKSAPGGITVIVFPADDKFWRPQTRRIQAARTNETGTYRIGNLPPGDYFLVAVDDAEQGEWFDPEYLAQIKSAAVRVVIVEGEQKTVDLTFDL